VSDANYFTIVSVQQVDVSNKCFWMDSFFDFAPGVENVRCHTFLRFGSGFPKARTNIWVKCSRIPGLSTPDLSILCKIETTHISAAQPKV
jgi:hypothetical protein